MAASLKNISGYVLLTLVIYFHIFLDITCSTNTQNDEFMFKDFIKRHDKPYENGTTEYNRRFLNFKASLKRHSFLNSKRTSNESAYYGVNKFSDLSQQEFQEKYLSQLSTQKKKYTEKHKIFQPYFDKMLLTDPGVGVVLKDIPKKVDWRTKNIVSGVKNQKACGGCWAFSSIETVESMCAKEKQVSPPSLSVQQVIDCAGFGNFGCKGGDICSALYWMNVTRTPLVPNSEYPLTDTSDYCKIEPPGTKGINLKNYTCARYIGKEEWNILNILANYGPVAISIDATTWNDYLGGIIQYHCPSHNNHAVQIVGYDLTGAVPYYIIRNSWGTDFGNDGYIYVKYGTNLCGIGNEVATVTVEADNC